MAINACRDLLKNPWRRRVTSAEVLAELPAPANEEAGDLLDAVLSLPKKYKDVLYLHYYEGYTAVQIAEILDKNVNTVYTLLSRGRQLLKEKIGGAPDGQPVEGSL